MSAKIKMITLGILAAVLLFPGLAGTQAPKAVYLKATFSGADQFGVPAKIQGDGKGSYQNARDLTVMFNDNDELEFVIGPRAGRRVNFIFDSLLGGPGPCGYCVGEVPPDTAGIDPSIKDEPTTYVSFLTTISSNHMGPQLNFLEMQPGEIAPVRLKIYFETTSRKYFRLKYYHSGYPEDNCRMGGPVMVRALDSNEDGTVDRWELYPVETDGDNCHFFREYARKGWDWQQCSFGYFRMPFLLTLDRLQ